MPFDSPLLFDMATAAGVAGAVALAGLTQGLSGFGFGLVALSLVSLLVDVAVAVPFLAVFSVAVNIVVFWPIRREFTMAGFLPLLIGAILGAPVGAQFLAEADPATVKQLVGGLLVAFVAWQGIRALRGAGDPSEDPFGISRWWGLPAGVAGGVLQGAFGTGGPPVVAYVAVTNWKPDTIKATLQAFFFSASSLQILAFSVEGLVTTHSLAANALFAPALLLGVTVGSKLYKRFDATGFRKVVMALLLLVGLNLLIRG